MVIVVDFFIENRVIVYKIAILFPISNKKGAAFTDSSFLYEKLI
jgi:hypothetical protein